MKNFLPLLLIVFSNWAMADQKDPRLPELFAQLKSAENEMQASQFEFRIWDIWAEHPDPEISALMVTAMDELGGDQYATALRLFTQIIERDPDFAEAWNMRATTHYILGNYRESEADIMKTLELEPNHFGALSGLAAVYVDLGQYNDARNALLRVLQINPTMQSAIANLEALRRFFNATAI
tara:strand:+ start:236300 stop:236842 length:543 start_codon:yes stop_codon:yes gene_type:complete